MLSVRRVSKRGTCTWSRKCIPGGEAAYAYQNLGPRYRHNPGHWLGGNHDRDGDVLNCHRGKHFRMPGKSTLSRRSNSKVVPRQHSAVSPQRPSRQPSAIAVWKTRSSATTLSDIWTRNLSLYQQRNVINP